MEGAANRNLLLRCIYVPQPAPPWMCSKCMEVSKLSCTSNSSPSAATLNKRDRHQLAERAPLLQREQEVHTSAQGLSHIVKYVSPTFVYIFLKGPPPPPPPRRHEQELLLFGQRQRGGCASLRRADAAQVCSNLGFVVADGPFECSPANAARQIVSERW